MELRSRRHPVCHPDTRVLLSAPRWNCGSVDVTRGGGGVCVRGVIAGFGGSGLSVVVSSRSISVLSLLVLT